MGEATTPSALDAERAAAAYLLNAKRPVVCVNGNAAALDAENLILLAKETNSKIEVNIFHRTGERMTLLTEYLRSCGAENVLGMEPETRIPGLSSERALCTNEGIFSSDVILVPIEDGDRAEALAKMGKVVIAIDLNPLSRTSRTASVSIADEMSRALINIIKFVRELRNDGKEREKVLSQFSNADNRKAMVDQICDELSSAVKNER
jgi:4-phosphopantoate--beta-alanine ligase